MPSTRLLLVNYHYVRERDRYPHPGIHPVEKRELAAQLDELIERFHMATPAEVEGYCHGLRPLPRDSIFLTFDDGLVDHIEVAREILAPRGVYAAFFVCSKPLLEGKAALVHKVHWLRATTEPDAFRSEVMGLLPERWRELASARAARREAEATYRYDTPAQAHLKYLINFQLPCEVVDEVLAEMFRRRNVAESDFCRRLYMSGDDLGELADHGHIVGCHGHSHTPFARLSAAQLQNEISTSLQCLESVTAHRPRWVSYPHGVGGAVPPDPESLAKRYGFTIGLTLRRDWNDGTQSPWALNRINRNELAQMIESVEAR